jgi:hypothetical protein
MTRWPVALFVGLVVGAVGMLAAIVIAEDEL